MDQIQPGDIFCKDFMREYKIVNTTGKVDGFLYGSSMEKERKGEWEEKEVVISRIDSFARENNFIVVNIESILSHNTWETPGFTEVTGLTSYVTFLLGFRVFFRRL